MYRFDKNKMREFTKYIEIERTIEFALDMTHIAIITLPDENQYFVEWLGYEGVFLVGLDAKRYPSNYFPVFKCTMSEVDILIGALEYCEQEPATEWSSTWVSVKRPLIRNKHFAELYRMFEEGKIK